MSNLTKTHTVYSNIILVWTVNRVFIINPLMSSMNGQVDTIIQQVKHYPAICLILKSHKSQTGPIIIILSLFVLPRRPFKPASFNSFHQSLLLLIICFILKSLKSQSQNGPHHNYLYTVFFSGRPIKHASKSLYQSQFKRCCWLI